jgi:RnfABCDGE-type electron transport complex B subunit
LLGRSQKPLNPVNGVEKPRTAALIDESRCIGCMLCIPACPVDAIVGSAKQMHTVLTEFCTGCDLCVPPCPSTASRWSAGSALEQHRRNRTGRPRPEDIATIAGAVQFHQPTRAKKSGEKLAQSRDEVAHLNR